MTHRASWIDLSASSSTNLLLPLMMIEQVLPGVAIPVIFTHLELPVCISSTRSALARFSAVKWSRDAMGRHPMVLHRKSTSSLSMSFTTMIFILSKRCDGATSDGLTQEVHVFPFDVLYHHDLHLVEEVDSQVGEAVSEDGLLDEENVAASLLHLLHNVEDIGALLTKNSIHGGVVRHHHLVVHVRLGGRHTELDEANLSLLHSLGAIDVGSLLLEDHTIHKFSVVHSAAQLLDNLDVLQIDIVLPCGVNHLEHSVHSNWAEFRAVLRHNLGVEAGVSRLQERLPVSEVKWGGHAGEDVHSLARRLLEALRDGGGVDSLLQQLVCRVQKRSGSHNDRCSSISSLNVLSLAQLDQHLSGRMDNSHLVQDRGAVVCDGHLALRVLDHLVHAPRSQASPDSFCKSFGRLDVALPDLFGLRVLGFHQPRASLARPLLCCSRISHPAVSLVEVNQAIKA